MKMCSAIRPWLRSRNAYRMKHRPRFEPAPHLFPPDPWNMVEKQYLPNLLEQGETMFALGNGYLGMRGCFEEGGPCGQNGTFINGFYEAWPIVYPEEAYGLAKTGQTIVNVTDTKIVKLYVDDEPFWLPHANVLSFDRRLNMRAGTLDREVLWETPAGKHVLIRSRRLISFEHRHVAAIWYQVTLLNARAPVVISSEMIANEPRPTRSSRDPRQARMFPGKVLHHRKSYATDRRIVLCHSTEQSQNILSCAIDHGVEAQSEVTWQASHTEDAGQVVFCVDAKPEQSVTLVNYMAYQTSRTAPSYEMSG